MKNNTIIKQFNIFISRNYDGLSAHTLFQTLTFSFPKEIAAQWVYVNIFHVFTEKYTPQDLDIAHCVADVIFNNPNLSNDIHYFRRELKELKFCIEFGYAYANTSYLKENALDMYLKNAISLCEFELIMKS
jgi:hypothetical protein